MNKVSSVYTYKVSTAKYTFDSNTYNTDKLKPDNYKKITPL